MGNDNHERRTQDDRERSQSQIEEITPVQVAARCDQHNSLERGRAQ